MGAPNDRPHCNRVIVSHALPRASGPPVSVRPPVLTKSQDGGPQRRSKELLLGGCSGHLIVCHDFKAKPIEPCGLNCPFDRLP